MFGYLKWAFTYKYFSAGAMGLGILVGGAIYAALALAGVDGFRLTWFSVGLDALGIGMVISSVLRYRAQP